MMTSSPTNPAVQCLIDMRNEIVQQKELTGTCTLSYWRLTDPKFFQALQDFASATDWPYEGYVIESCRQEAQDLFTRLNKIMLEQERDKIWANDNDNGRVPNTRQYSIVFGGKWAVESCSIAEELVHQIQRNASQESQVYTVSRTPVTDSAHPSNVVHFSKQNLELDGGHAEFEFVMNQAVKDWEDRSKSKEDIDSKTPIIFYFTLGKHRGKNLPFQRNIQGADNFISALKLLVPQHFDKQQIPWRVVITGTDATNPSTQPDPSLTVDGVPTTIPSYKMVPYNTVYAASKLYQFYSIASAVAQLTGTRVTPALTSTRHDGSLDSITNQLHDYVVEAGDNGTYQPNDILTDKELDGISRYWAETAEPALHVYIQTAKNISICYTPLHRDPWTEMCLTDRSKESPKKFMIQNIVWRLKNAISIDRAARAHF